VLAPICVQNAGKRLKHSRINTMQLVYYFKPDSSGLKPGSGSGKKNLKKPAVSQLPVFSRSYTSGGKICSIFPSYRRKPVSSAPRSCRAAWIPAFAGMTNVNYPSNLFRLRYLNFHKLPSFLCSSQESIPPNSQTGKAGLIVPITWRNGPP